MTANTTYFPPPGQNWERRAPQELGVDPERLSIAVQFAVDNEVDWPIDLSQQDVGEDAGQWATRLGRFKHRGGPTGVVLRHGYIIAEWGEVGRVDLTYSATKSYVATVAGLAFDRGLIQSVDDPVAAAQAGVAIEYSSRAVAAIQRLHNRGDDAQLNSAGEGIGVDGFDSDHNASITWRQMLQQTNEWQGWLYGKPDIVDWNRGVETAVVRQERKAPGVHWEYNDVRVNRTALALLSVWREPLPVVLKREVMDPIGASDSWEWHGYDDYSTVLVAGAEVESVSGGAHWGGGLWIDSLDHARFGLLFASGGAWDGQRVISKDWCRMMREPCPINSGYGFMWWLNTDHERYGATASEATFAASGAGGNSVVCDPERDLVIVTRWCADVSGVVDRVARSVL
jgi:CubicO group peptidase (beta-lactamase class C family)